MVKTKLISVFIVIMLVASCYAGCVSASEIESSNTYKYDYYLKGEHYQLEEMMYHSGEGTQITRIDQTIRHITPTFTEKIAYTRFSTTNGGKTVNAAIQCPYGAPRSVLF